MPLKNFEPGRIGFKFTCCVTSHTHRTYEDAANCIHDWAFRLAALRIEFLNEYVEKRKLIEEKDRADSRIRDDYRTDALDRRNHNLRNLDDHIEGDAGVKESQ